MVGYPGSAICGPLRSTWKHHPDRFGSLSRNSAIAKASQSSWGWIMNLSHLSSMDSPSGASALRTARRVSTYRLSWDARLPRRCSTRTNARRGRTSILPPKASALPLFAIAPAGFLGTSSALPVLVATCAIPPLMGLWKNEYTVSFGYAGAMAVSGGVALAAGGLGPLAACHAGLVCAYGLRLGLFLLWRQITIQRFRQFVERIESRAPANRFKRFPFILGCAALYLGMVAPLVLTARYEAAASDAALGICKACLGAAACGGLIEAIGDAQKSFYKSLSRDPTVRWVDQGLFSVVRHPNYTGEQLLWVGSFGAGVACAAPSIMSCWGWMVGAVLGLLGIQFVLVQATTGLERRQQEAYGGSPEFQAYKGRTWGGFTFPAKKAEADSAQKQF